MQRIIYFQCSSVCDYLSFVEGDNDAQFYFNQRPFIIQPQEEVIIIIRNCGNHWLAHGLTYLMRNVNQHFYLMNERPYQQALLLKNSSKQFQVEVPPQTPLTTVLLVPEIYYRVVHAPVTDFLH